jgi:hypothetical protein
MPQRGHSPDDDVIGDEFDEVLGRANPNPERIGCPPRETLVELARRVRPIGDPGYQHLLKCSPCYVEVRSLQVAEAPRTPHRSGRPTAWLALAAALILVVLGGVLFWQRASRVPDADAPAIARNEPSASVPPTVSTSPPVQTQLDLRNFSVFRGAQGQAPPSEVVTLPAGVVDLTLLLPIGSEPGAYEVQLLDSDLKSVASGRGTGEVRNFVTTVRVTLDLSAAPRGAYQLAVRREDDQWRMFAARVE